MPRRKLQDENYSGKADFKFKFIPVFFDQEEKHSPHVLNLLEKLTPPVKPSWQPTDLDRILSNPLGELEKIGQEKIVRANPVEIKHNFKLPKEPLWKKLHWEKPNWKFPSFNWSKIKFQLPQRKTVSIKPKSPIIKIKQPAPAYVSYHLPHWQKAIAGFAAMAILFVLPVKAFSAYYQLRDSQQNIVDSGTVAFEHLTKGQEALQKGDFASASQELQFSLNSFAEAQNKLKDIHPIWRSLLYLTPKVGDKIKNGEQLMIAGSNLTMGSLPILYLLTEQNQSSLSLSKIKQTLDEIAPRFAKTNESLMQVNPGYLPENNRASFIKIRETISLLSDDLQKITSLSKSLMTAAGENEEKTYLLIFQNNHEIRATGGFIGSYAELKIKNGQITKIDLPGEGSYNLQGNLTANLIPPAPLQLLQPRWEFRDANWFADFPTSAKKLMWFYEKSGGPTVDGVIALDTNPLIDLLKITGPISLANHNLIINSENFIDAVQQKVEIDYDKTKNQPKEILADLAPILIEKIFNEKNNFLPLLSLINKNLSEKHIQFFFTDSALQKDIIAQGWGGELKNNPNGDFLAVVNTNIGGEKSDRVIEQTIQHQAKIAADGTVTDTVTITRHNPGSTSIFSNAKNNSYIRFYVPQGSQLISASGFVWPEETNYQAPEKWFRIDEDLQKINNTQIIDEKTGTIITKETGKTVFANWMIVPPQETAIATITYQLPFKIKTPENKQILTQLAQFFQKNENYSSYSLLVQKQAGSHSDILENTITWPENWQTLWTNPTSAAITNNSFNSSSNLSGDEFIGIVFENSSKL